MTKDEGRMTKHHFAIRPLISYVKRTVMLSGGEASLPALE
jgi:hypothetical protein